MRCGGQLLHRECEHVAGAAGDRAAGVRVGDAQPHARHHRLQLPHHHRPQQVRHHYHHYHHYYHHHHDHHYHRSSMTSPTNTVLLAMAVCDLLTILLPGPW